MKFKRNKEDGTYTAVGALGTYTLELETDQRDAYYGTKRHGTSRRYTQRLWIIYRDGTRIGSRREFKAAKERTALIDKRDSAQ